VTTKLADMPATVIVGSVTYRVTIDPDDWMRYEHKNQSKGCYGHTDHVLALILLNPESAPDVARQTLWHELIHALCEVTMGRPDWRGLGKEQVDREEAVVRAFESPVLLVLRDNPDLVAYLAAVG